MGFTGRDENNLYKTKQTNKSEKETHAAGVHVCSEANVLTEIFLPGLMNRAVASPFKPRALFSLALKDSSLCINLALACTAVIPLFEGDRCNEERSKTFQLQPLLISLCLGPSTVRAPSLTQIFPINTCGKILWFYSRLQDRAHSPGLTGSRLVMLFLAEGEATLLTFTQTTHTLPTGIVIPPLRAT